MPIQFNTETIDASLLTAGGTVSLDVNSNVNLYFIEGTVSPTSNIIIQESGTASEGLVYNFKYKASVDLVTNGVTMTIFGTAISSAQSLQNSTINCYYINGGWEVEVLPDFTQDEIITTNLIDTTIGLSASVLDDDANSGFFTVDVSFESGEQQSKKIYLYGLSNGLILEHIGITVSKTIEATDPALLTFISGVQVGPNLDLSTAGGNVVTIPAGTPDNIAYVYQDDFVGPTNDFPLNGALTVIPSKATPGGKVTLTIHYIKK